MSDSSGMTQPATVTLFDISRLKGLAMSRNPRYLQVMATGRDIIAKLGGYRAVAVELKIKHPQNVHRWTRAGETVPSRYWPALLRLAKTLNVTDLTLDVLEDAKPNPVGGEKASSEAHVA